MQREQDGGVEARPAATAVLERAAVIVESREAGLTVGSGASGPAIAPHAAEPLPAYDPRQAFDPRQIADPRRAHDAPPEYDAVRAGGAHPAYAPEPLWAPGPAPSGEFGPYDPHRTAQPAGRFVAAPRPPVRAVREKAARANNPLGYTGAILAILGLLSFFEPFFRLFDLFTLLSPIALVFSIIGIVRARRIRAYTPATALGASVTGLVLSGVEFLFLLLQVLAAVILLATR